MIPHSFIYLFGNFQKKVGPLQLKSGSILIEKWLHLFPKNPEGLLENLGR